MVSKAIIIGVIVVAVVVLALGLGLGLGLRNRNSCDTADPPTNVTFTRNTNNVVVSWLDLENSEDCTVTYRLEYDVDGGTKSALNTTANTYTITNNIEPCAVLSVSISAIGDSGEFSEEELEDTYIVPPATITPPSNLEVVKVNENLVISWEEPADLSKCEGLSYQISFVTDSETSIPAATTNGNSYSIDYNLFCLQAEVSVATIYDGEPGEPETKSYEESSDVINLEVSRSTEGLLTVSWADHPKADSCSISYSVYHRIDDEEYADVTPEEGVMELVLDYEYCQVAYIRIVVEIEDGESQEIIEDITQYPTVITPPSNLDLRKVDENLVISWEEPADLSKCEGLSYQISFVTDSATAIPSATVDVNSHTIDYNSFCLQADVSVATIYDGVTGVPEQKSYE